MERVEKLAKQSAVVVFSKSSCCMCHAMKRLFRELGVNAMVVELDQEPKGKDMERALASLIGGNGRNPPVPAVYIGGRLVGPTERVMAHHINGTLVHMLREAGALWIL
ncbi:Monothiol glutaredoxin-S8 [Nymphaea thermarum]|uniref:Glutaredoxin domain-containing protein n=1 Tax=Nymphaea colorata TaxID=210225 RepID=A0A5K1DIW9_9MAGN|nr:glutaredoxin-C1-like [Nymphaea colorata]KAF3782274.1 Monothiol glutaredoxin-S8 [Nymphaea thermarum]